VRLLVFEENLRIIHTEYGHPVEELLLARLALHFGAGHVVLDQVRHGDANDVDFAAALLDLGHRARATENLVVGMRRNDQQSLLGPEVPGCDLMHCVPFVLLRDRSGVKVRKSADDRQGNCGPRIAER